jgi:hypothetical protein
MNHYEFSPISRCDASFLPLARFAAHPAPAAASKLVRNKLLYEVNLWQFCYLERGSPGQSGAFVTLAARIEPRIDLAFAASGIRDGRFLRALLTNRRILPRGPWPRG